MNNIIEFFYNLYENKEEIYDFVFAPNKFHYLFKINNKYKLINNKEFFALKINEYDEKIYLTLRDGSYLI